MKVAVVGASGLVGAAVTDALLKTSNVETVPLINSAGNAWGLARLGLDLRIANLLDRDSLAVALEGCTHVINCSRGGSDVMFKGLKNLIRQCRAQNVQKFVHLSSVAVYGDPPPPDSVQESASARPEKGSYGWLKLKQDNMVESAAKDGLPVVNLCPPNILGPSSYFLIQLIDLLRKGQLLLADDGALPCCTVDVANLAHAAVLALSSDVSDGRRLFITDDSAVTWRLLVDGLLPLIENAPDVPSVSKDRLAAMRPPSSKPKKSVLNAMKHLFSGDVRQALREDPLLEVIDSGLRNSVGLLGAAVESRMRQVIAGPIQVPKRSEGIVKPHLGMSLQQLRGVMHSCDAAKQRVGYDPVITTAGSLEAFSRWYRRMHGLDTPFADLCREL